MSDEESICPRHNIPYRLRRNVKTGEIALACYLCDIEINVDKDRNNDANPSEGE